MQDLQFDRDSDIYKHLARHHGGDLAAFFRTLVDVADWYASDVSVSATRLWAPLGLYEEVPLVFMMSSSPHVQRSFNKHIQGGAVGRWVLNPSSYSRDFKRAVRGPEARVGLAESWLRDRD